MRNNSRDVLYNVARCLATATVIISVWLFASAEPWAYLCMGLLSGLALLVWLFAMFRDSSDDVSYPMLGIGLLVFFLILQAVPLPLSLLRVLSPLSASTAESLRETFEHTGLLPLVSRNGASGTGTLSLCPHATWRALYLFAAYAGICVTLRGTIRTWEQLRGVATAIVVSGFLMAVVSLVHHFSQSDRIFWLHLPRHGGAVFGPFTNRNHFAAHANMLIGIGLGLLLAARVELKSRSTDAWRAWLNSVSSPLGTGAALAAFAIVLLGATVCLTLSRGGMVSLFASMLIFSVGATLARRHTRGMLPLVAGLGVGMVGLIYWLGDDPVVRRLSTLGDITLNPTGDLRAVVTRDTLKVFAALPACGSGFGTFRHVFSMFQSPSLEYRWLHAHNDWVQLLAEGGVVGALLFLFAVGQWGVDVRKRFPTASRRARVFIIGVLFGILTISIHGVVDYSLHKPANALLLAALFGLVAAASRIKSRQGRRSAELVAGGEPPRTRARLAGLTGLVGVTLLMGMMVRELRQELAFARFLYLRELAARAIYPEEFRRVMEWAVREAVGIAAEGSYNPDASVEVSHTLLQWCGDERVEPAMQRRLADIALEGAVRATAGARSDYLAWLALARAQAALGEWDGAELALDMARRLTGGARQIRMFEPVPEQGPFKQIP